MYQIFDKYLDSANFSGTHASDTRLFNEALQKIVDDPRFDADDMGQYMLNKFSISIGAKDLRAERIEKLIIHAEAIKDFLEDTKR
ncbi:hypothetical protein [Pseudochelatococcus sp. G4_1912]|uniref:hypothetical protein n=1 Tax=Pseudochelatococcus sp. G4_1912 TaxID=3114288 RepID=UPI0039C7596F